MDTNWHTIFAPTGFWRFIRSLLPRLTGFVTWRTLSVLVTVPLPILTQRIVDDAIATGSHRITLIYTAVGGVLLAAHVFSMRQSVEALSDRTQRILREMRARIFQKLQFIHFGFLDRNQSGRLLSKYAFDTQNIEGTLIPMLNQILPELIRSALLIVALVILNSWNLLFIVFSIVTFWWIRRRYFEPIEAVNHDVRLARERLTGQASEFISAIKLVRGFGQESEVGQHLEAVSGNLAEKRAEQMRLNQTLGYVSFTAFTGINLLAVGLGAALVIGDQMTVGNLLALVGSLPVILGPVQTLSAFSLQYFLAAEAYRSIKELVDSGYVEQWQGQRELEPMRGEIEFDEVSFGYGGTEGERVLDNLSLRIEAGESVGLVGASGSGKSTLVNLVLGLYAPTAGEIRIDGVPQRNLAMRALRRRCAIVMQDNLLLSGTIMDNIRFGRPEATVEEAWEAAREANALEFIEGLAEGMETRVGERGVALSGGQRQRIAIARALLRDPRILILDEATSALDYESEHRVQEALDRLVRGRTTITIAHRLSTIRNVDRVVVMAAGRIVEVGPPDVLAAKSGGAYRELLAKMEAGRAAEGMDS